MRVNRIRDKGQKLEVDWQRKNERFLRIPENGTELPLNAVPDADEDPFFCLLENDSLVTDLNITTDRLLRPLRLGENENDVVLVMKIHVKASAHSAYNLPLF